jgi:hypothetical protein
METKPRFDLNQSVGQWRAALAQSAALRAEELDELEHHLHDSVTELRGHQLTEEESFLVATRRLGGGEDIAREYAKAHPNRVWTTRSFWMLSGLFLFQLASLPNTALRQLSMTIPSQINGHWLGLAIVTVQWGSLLAAVGTLLWLMNSKSDRLARCKIYVIQHPVLITTGLLALAGLLFALPILSWLLMVLRINPAPWTQEMMMRQQTINVWQIFGFSLVQQILIPILLVWLARRVLAPRLAK